MGLSVRSDTSFRCTSSQKRNHVITSLEMKSPMYLFCNALYRHRHRSHTESQKKYSVALACVLQRLQPRKLKPGQDRGTKKHVHCLSVLRLVCMLGFMSSKYSTASPRSLPSFLKFRGQQRRRPLCTEGGEQGVLIFLCPSASSHLPYLSDPQLSPLLSSSTTIDFYPLLSGCTTCQPPSSPSRLPTSVLVLLSPLS